jgi:hypothetical protein
MNFGLFVVSALTFYHNNSLNKRFNARGDPKKIFSKNFAPTPNFLPLSTNAPSSRALSKKYHVSALNLVKVHRKFQPISSQ